jgi:hypothetical protein
MYSNGSATLPRGFRFHYDEPKTPEPLAQEEELRQPSPPRPRLKVRRRNASSSSGGFQAPTQQFLASVAAADIPIPTIEEPMRLLEDFDMPDREPLSMQTSGLLAPRNNLRFGSPPKTPMPESTLEEGASGRPDWTVGSISPPSDYFQRPLSSLSNHSDFSDDSFYSGGRLSRPSEDGSCTSPESDCADPFQFPNFKGKGKPLFHDPAPQPHFSLNAKLRSKTKNNAPWTKAQSAHLWATYMMYLSDPTVTPFRIGASAVPPQGIVHRVAREAKRSWKGPGGKLPISTVRRSTRSNPSRANSYDKSGSITPTAEVPKVYSQWPHSSNVTRAHLRELCKTKDENPVQRHHHLQSRSPTPFTKPHYRFLKSETPRLSSFTTSDIALSLATSTSDSMQPDGPLAQLAADGMNPALEASSFPPLQDFKPLSFGASRGLNDDSRGRRLGSPFAAARTYGPSSSKPLNSFVQSPPRNRSDTVTAQPRLGSPVRFDGPRSLNTTMKRRAQNPLDEELSPHGAALRPSILNDQLFGAEAPFQQSRRRVRSRGFSLGDEALRHRVPGIFQRSPTVPLLPTALESPIPEPTPTAPPKLLPSITFDPPRLGSPFSESGSSKTFPRRLFQDGTATIRRSQFATMHQTRRSVDSFSEAPVRSRLSHLDDKLREIRERHAGVQG